MAPATAGTTRACRSASTRLEDVDIDPGWYPGQPELEDESGTEGVAAGDNSSISPGSSVPLPGVASSQSNAAFANEGPADGLGAAPGQEAAARADGPAHGAQKQKGATSMPSVLTKLQKWGDYASVGGQVVPTRFIPMKTPLSEELLASWSLPSAPRHRLTVGELMAQQAALGRRVGLLLDLSNHDCLYEQDIPPDVQYTHVQLVAKELPPREFVQEVLAVAHAFWAERPDDYIAIHCAYGFNRTGFVVCCYLIEVCGLSVEEALASFASSRPPGVKHEAFRAELHRRYGNHQGQALGLFLSPPDDNSSIGCSPSCRSTELRDLLAAGVGASPGWSPYGVGGAVGTLEGSLYGAAAGRAGMHATPLGARATISMSGVGTVAGMGLGGAGTGLLAGAVTAYRAVSFTTGSGAGAGSESGSALRSGVFAAGRSNSGALGLSAAGDAAMDRQASMSQYSENESLGAVDRQLLQAFRQQHISQSHTIPEESGSQHESPMRGQSVNSANGASAGRSGRSSSAQGRYSRKSLDSIDWAAAAAEDTSSDKAAAAEAFELLKM